MLRGWVSSYIPRCSIRIGFCWFGINKKNQMKRKKRKTKMNPRRMVGMAKRAEGWGPRREMSESSQQRLGEEEKVQN